ncbi:hypothetical protein [Roseateles sp.]|jgi:NADH:ubiquinone oxidoreductase subunit 6 (subunit J)|uniref:hypothetical protein n=1 Tax=Roseateles sp. TaxID=1971397 RepID=UPI00391A1765
MYLVAIAWLYVVVMMALAEAVSSQGTLLGALFTLLLYGLLPLSIVMYLLGTPARRRARRLAEQAQAEQAEASAEQPDGRDHATALPAEEPLAPVRKEP